MGTFGAIEGTRSSISRQMDDTWLREIPVIPIDWTSASTDAVYPCFLDNRVEGPLRHPACLKERREVRAFTKLRDTQVQCAEPGVVLAVKVAIPVSLTSIAALSDIGLHDTVEHKFGEFTQKVFTTGLHQGVAECHAVVGHRFAPFKIIVWITITLPDKPMALTILPNLHHVLGLYRGLAGIR